MVSKILKKLRTARCGDNEKLMFVKKQLTYGNVFSVKCFRDLHILETNVWTQLLKKLFTH